MSMISVQWNQWTAVNPAGKMVVETKGQFRFSVADAPSRNAIDIPQVPPGFTRKSHYKISADYREAEFVFTDTEE